MTKKNPSYINIWPQAFPHAGATITLNLAGLIKLCWACFKLIFSRVNGRYTLEVFNSDGEKYDLNVRCVSDDVKDFLQDCLKDIRKAKNGL